MTELKEVSEIKAFLEASLKALCPPLRVRKEGPNGLEVCGRKEVMQGKQQVDGYYFASTVLKPKDVRLYFFPIYTDPELYTLSPDLQKMLKGKSCFHLKGLTPAVQAELQEMMAVGLRRYQEKELL